MVCCQELKTPLSYHLICKAGLCFLNSILNFVYRNIPITTVWLGQHDSASGYASLCFFTQWLTGSLTLVSTASLTVSPTVQVFCSPPCMDRLCSQCSCSGNLFLNGERSIVLVGYSSLDRILDILPVKKPNWYSQITTGLRVLEVDPKFCILWSLSFC